MAKSTDPFDALRRPLAPRRVRPQFAAALRRRIEEELNMTNETLTTGLRVPAMFHIKVHNADRAMAFFEAVFDWESSRYDAGDYVRHYMTNISGSLPVLTDEPGEWAVRIGFHVDDIDAAIATIEQQGGRIAEHEDSWAMGFDNQGIALTVWVPGNDYPHEPPTKTSLGELNWFEVITPSTADATRFYGALFGWNVEDVEPGYSHVVDESGQVRVSVIERPGPAWVMPHVTVTDIESARTRIAAAGGVASPTWPAGPGMASHCRDDQGTEFGLWQPLP